MLNAAARLRRTSDFGRVTRSGVRAGRPTLVLYVAPGTTSSTRVGTVVSKAVGNAVTRNRVKRRLRHLAGAQLASTDRADVVIRALPAAATVPARLPEDFTGAWTQALGKLSRRAVTG